MFVYEKGNSLNLTFKGSTPVENPEVIIKGYENGASLTVNGTEVVSVTNAVEFEGKAKTFVFQKAGKLMITFKGIEGMSNPEVTIDETTDGVYEAVVNGTNVTLTLTEDKVSVGVQGTIEPPVVEDEESSFEDPVIPDEPEEETLPKNVEGEEDSDVTVEDL